MPSRIKYIFLLLCFGFLAILGKLFYWQVIERKFLFKLAQNQYLGFREIPASRGKIITSDQYPLVLNQLSYNLYANPNIIKNKPEELVEKLNTITGKKIQNWHLLGKKGLYWVPLLNDIDETVKNNIEVLNIEGFDFEEKNNRFYPEASMAAQIVGFVGTNDKGQEKGYFGIEGYYDKELRGKSGIRYYDRDALGRPIVEGKNFEEKAISGRNLKLNLNRLLQYLVEKDLEKGIIETGAISGWAIVANLQDGAILAASSFPAFSPQNYNNYDSNLYQNPLISSVFEPGSIFKTVTMACAIENKAVNFDEKCTRCDGPRNILDYQIKTWNDKYFPNSSMTDIIVHSDNVGMVYVIEKLGEKRFLDCLGSFGFSQLTGIDLQGEISAEIKPLKEWSRIDLATASFGQGLAVTPIQILSAISTIANKGERYRPFVVQNISDEGKEIPVKPQKKNQAISPRTAELVKEMMVQAVEKNNVRKLAPAGFKIAGKSGTAQVPVKGGYDPSKTIASFIGFFPVEKPKFAILVTLKEPKSSPWAESTAAPIWFKIVKNIIRLWKIKP